MVPMTKTSVLIIDDSKYVRTILEHGINKDEDLVVLGTAKDAYSAREKILELRPDVLTLDINMPKMDGLTFLKKLLPQYPIPVIMVSSVGGKGERITLEALSAGAVDFVMKPSSVSPKAVTMMLSELCAKLKLASKVNLSALSIPKSKKMTTIGEAKRSKQIEVIAIGGSTGAPAALRRVLTQVPSMMPGIVVVLHMPAQFTKIYATQLSKQCNFPVKEAKNGSEVSPGQVLLAPGGQHMTLKRLGSKIIVQLNTSERVNGHRPSVDVLFNSCASELGKKSFGIILSGMGKDGANGLLNMKRSGAITLGQDDASSVVFGMPKSAVEAGAVNDLVHIEKMGKAIEGKLR